MSLKQEVDRILRELENGDGGHVPVLFYERSTYDETQSKLDGKPVYKNVLFVKKHKDNLSVYDSIARDEDIKQYPKQYELYQKNRQLREEGVPVGMLPGITPAQVSRCEACRIFTVEGLSKAEDTVILDIGDKGLRDRAIAYLNGESEKDLRIKELEKQLASLKDDNSKHSAGHSRRGATVRKAIDSGGEREQGNEAVASVSEDG